MTNSKPVILVDGSSYLFRAFHAMPSFTNSKGQPTGAIYGVANMIRRLISDYDPEDVAIVFDAKGKTFRNDMYPEYKANRPPMPEELKAQIEPLHKVIKAMGLPLLCIEGVEADDVIGTLAQQATEHQLNTIISTGDKDMAQLVNEHVTLINTMNDSRLDTNGVVEKFGIPPNRIIDYLALIGDTVDNIPGVPKCGPKTAVKWLSEFDSLQGVMDNADKISGKVGENLRATLEQLPLSYQLATIKCDVELPFGINDLQYNGPDQEALVELVKELEFKTWLRELLGEEKPTVNVQPKTAKPIAQDSQYEIVTDQASFDTWLKRLEQAELFAFDTETTSLDYMQAEIVGVSFATEAFHAAYVPVAHDYEGAPTQLNRESVLNALKPLLENPARAKLGQNLKYDMNVLANYDIHLRGIAHDTMLESYVLDSVATRHDMDSLALKYLGHKTIHFEDIAGKGAKQKTFNEIDIAEAGPYAAEDADITLRLHGALWPKLQAEPGLSPVYTDIEIPLEPVLARMERTGVLVDANKLQAQSGELEVSIAGIEQEAYKLAGGEFNLGSPKQLQKILFEDMGLPVVRKTPKGQPSTAEDVLQELADEYELPSLILKHRSFSKLKSTYTDKLPQQIDSRSGRVHTSYHQAVAATGRLSSSDPNLQNIPVRTEEGRRIRQAFVASPGYRIVAADYSQIELRIMAHLSDDPGLLTAFQKGEDIHRATAADVMGVPLEEVTSEHRRSAKAINFGLIYGMSAFGLSKQLGIERNEAQEYMDQYFHKYPGVQAYMDNIRAQARDRGYVETLFGRRLYLPDIRANNHQRRQYAERTAINAPMQGTAADIIKKAMIAVDQWIQGQKDDVRLIMQVHDELVFEIREEMLEPSVAEIRGLMQSAAELKVPLLVDVGIGNNWDEAH
ncbi:MAG: DNA polymerase I [Gammaproteobacteria bacterium]|nr:DNA polymerase I [Gammaproteobacteria bacterium]